MHPFLHNKFIRFGLFGMGGLAIIFIAVIVLMIVQNAHTTSLGLSSTDMDYAPSPMSFDGGSLRNNGIIGREIVEMDAASSYYNPPVPTPTGYTSGLESYETTSYMVGARSKEFDALCDTLATLKGDPHIHFKTLTSSINACRATFFVAEEKVAEVLRTLTTFHDVEVTRNTESVTRHKQQLESQTTILQQQLARIESSLFAAQAQLDRLNQIFNTSDEVTRLSSEVTKSLQYIDQLTQKKISLLDQLNRLYQQSADLNERINVVQFDVTITRAIPITTNKHERQWDLAWEKLKEEFTNTLIGITAFFGIFLLWTLRIGLYLLVLIVLVRLLWKFGKMVWRKW